MLYRPLYYRGWPANTGPNTCYGDHCIIEGGLLIGEQHNRHDSLWMQCICLFASTHTLHAQIHVIEEPFLNINCSHLQRFNPDLYSQLVRYPQEVIPTFDLAANELFEELYPDTQLEHQIQVRCVGVCGCVWV